MARGGRRVGRVGTAYANRSDLNGTGKVPVTAAPGQTYGEAGAQRAAQQIVPMANPAPVSTAAASVSPAPSAPQLQPGGLGDLARGTERPNEPLTTGLPSGAGAGPGPEVLGLSGSQTLGSMLSSLAAQPFVSPEVAALAATFQSR